MAAPDAPGDAAAWSPRPLWLVRDLLRELLWPCSLPFLPAPLAEYHRAEPPASVAAAAAGAAWPGAAPATAAPAAELALPRPQLGARGAPAATAALPAVPVPTRTPPLTAAAGRAAGASSGGSGGIGGGGAGARTTVRALAQSSTPSTSAAASPAPTPAPPLPLVAAVHGDALAALARATLVAKRGAALWRGYPLPETPQRDAAGAVNVLASWCVASR